MKICTNARGRAVVDNISLVLVGRPIGAGKGGVADRAVNGDGQLVAAVYIGAVKAVGGIFRFNAFITLGGGSALRPAGQTLKPE